MASKTKDIGTIGEHAVMLEFLKNGITVLEPIGDNTSYDFVIEINNKFYKIQVKTTEEIKDGTMLFQTNITNPFKQSYRLYNKDEVDCFGLYCIENNYIGLLPYEFYTSKETVMRLVKPKNNQKAKIKMAEDFSFNKILNEYFNIGD